MDRAMRFHLSFDYEARPAHRSSGDQVVIADDIEGAARQIARERNVTSIHIRKRFRLGEPASAAEVIDRDFEFA